MPPPPPSESDITGEIPPLGGTYTCRAVVRRFSTDPGHQCGGQITWVHGRQPGGYWAHVDRALDRDHQPKRHDPLRGTEQPRGGLRGWLDSKRHRSWLVNTLLVLGVVSYTLWRVGIETTLILAAVLTVMVLVAVGASQWIKHASRP